MSNADLKKTLAKVKTEQAANVEYNDLEELIESMKQEKPRRVAITFHVDEALDTKLCDIANASRQSKSRVIQKLLSKALGQ